jgi:Kinesin-associated protein (KAP)
MLDETTNIKALAKEIIEKCKLIHPSKIVQVEQLLFYLQNRKDTSPTKGWSFFVTVLFFFQFLCYKVYCCDVT